MTKPKYCVSLTNRIIGQKTANPTGFIVFNISKQKCFVVSDGMWASNSIMPQSLVNVWNLNKSVFTYYIDPINGSDSNLGTSIIDAWQTTTPADAVTLTGTQTIGYKYNSTWKLYRTLDETIDLSLLPINIITETTDKF